MSKNIDEIFKEYAYDGLTMTISGFKQALTEKKLVVPLSLNKIMTIILDYSDTSSHQDAAYLGNKIHEAQFKEIA